MAAVDAAFVETGRGLAGWADPYPDRSPPDEAYSRVTDPCKWRILCARAEAWLAAVAAAGLAEVDSAAEIEWEAPPRLESSRRYRATPRLPDALPLIVQMERMDDVDDVGVTLGVGNPTVVVLETPDCGCDACDSGSQDALEELDEHVLGVVTGAYRRLSRGERTITMISPIHLTATNFVGSGEGLLDRLRGLTLVARPGRSRFGTVSSSGYFVKRPRRILSRLRMVAIRLLLRRRRRDGIERVLADPKGWDELSGASWLGQSPTTNATTTRA